MTSEGKMVSQEAPSAAFSKPSATMRAENRPRVPSPRIPPLSRKVFLPLSTGKDRIAPVLIEAFTYAAVGVAIVAAIAAVWLLRDMLASEARTRTLAGEAESLADQLFAATERLERQRQLIENQSDLVVSRDLSGRITVVNEAFARAALRSPESLTGTTFDFPAPREPIGKPGTTHETYGQAIRLPDGEHWIQWSVLPMLDPDGRVMERYAVGRDVTETRRAEAASEAKSRFLATVSHEVRTPLNGVLGMADLLMDTALEPEQKTYVRAIKTSGEALLSLIDEILDFSRIEAGKTGLVEGAFDLHGMAEGVVELLAPRAQGKDLEIALSIEAGTPREVVGDGARIRQILINLSGNAVKFTEHGGVGVSVSGNQDGIVLLVSDTGPGIRPDRQEAIFEEFEQAEDAVLGASEGTGLGLAISRRLAEQMGGTLTVDSTPGQGSSFSLRLPLRPALGGAPDAPPDLDIEGRMVLVAAGGPFEGRYLAARLTDLGASVRLCASADEAMRALGEARYALAMIDCSLGPEATRALGGAALAAGVAQRIVLLSPYERRSFGPPTEAGFDGYLVKPVRVRSLHARLRPHDLRVQPELSATIPAANQPPSMSVLLAEDNEINALLAMRLLEKHGCAVTLVKDGEAALQALTDLNRQPPFAAALLDVRMPRLDGRRVAEAVRQLEQRSARVPIRLAAVTANASAEDRRASLAAGFDAFIPKPLDRAAIAAFVAEARARTLAQAA